MIIAPLLNRVPKITCRFQRVFSMVSIKQLESFLDFGTLLVDGKFELDMNLTKVEDLKGTIDMSYYNEPNSKHLIGSNGILNQTDNIIR